MRLRDQKPLLNEHEQVTHLKSKGVTFNLVNEDDAYHYLRFNNNYFKLASYRKNYPVHTSGANSGKYINLDFGHLRDLAIIDMDLRYTLLQLSLDIEHYTKLQLLRIIVDNQEDGYSICSDFISSLSEEQRKILEKEIERNNQNVYCGDLAQKYASEMPVWVMLELIPFGRMISFYGFCADRYKDKKMKDTFYILRSCRDIRNAAAHSSCILNDLHADTATYNARYSVLKALSQIPDLSKNARTKKMSNARIQQIITTLFMHKTIVTSAGVHEKTASSLSAFKKRMNKNISYYDSNDLIRTNFAFLSVIIDKWFPCS